MAMRWPWHRQVENAAPVVTVDSPLFAQFINPYGTSLAGVTVDERTALGLSAMFRAVSLVSGTLASLPLRSLRKSGDTQEQVPSIFDDPDGPDGQTPFEWKETLFAHQIIHGRAGALKVRNAAGGIVRLPLVHPLMFRVEEPKPEEYREPASLPKGGLWFVVTLASGEQRRYDAEDFWYVPALSMNGVDGLGLLGLAETSLGTTVAADRAASRVFSNGALISGLATPEDDFDLTEDLPEIRRQLDRSVTGYENAGGIAVVNRRLRFTPWTMTAQQAQFLESRQFQIEEISRWTGVPPHLLMQTEKQTSWGTGVDEQNRGLSKFVLGHWAQRLEQRASRLLAQPRWCEFDFAALERPNFEANVTLVLAQIEKGLISAAYGRKLLNIPEDAAPAPAPAPAPPPAADDEGADDDPAAE
jgi:HK97 family phage portal protein